MPRFITVDEAAESLRLNPKTVLKLCQRGELPAHKFGDQWRIDADAVASLCTSRMVDHATAVR